MFLPRKSAKFSSYLFKNIVWIQFVILAHNLAKFSTFDLLENLLNPAHFLGLKIYKVLLKNQVVGKRKLIFLTPAYLLKNRVVWIKSYFILSYIGKGFNQGSCFLLRENCVQGRSLTPWPLHPKPSEGCNRDPRT